MVLRDDINRPVKTNTCGHQTMWTVFVDRGTCPICEEAERYARQRSHHVTGTPNSQLSTDSLPPLADSSRKQRMPCRSSIHLFLSFITLMHSHSNTPFTITYNMRCRHITFKARGVRGEGPLYIISSNLTSTKDNPPNSLSGGFCELCYLKVTMARGMKAWSWDQALLSRPGLSRLR